MAILVGEKRFRVPNKVLQLVEARKNGPTLFSVSSLAAELGVSKIAAANYLSRLNRLGAVERVSKGFYSAGARFEPLPLAFDKKEARVRHLIKKAMPFARFVVWSTRRLSAFYHNVPRRYFYFVETEPETAEGIAELLRENNFPSVVLGNRVAGETARELVLEPVFVLKTRSFLGVNGGKGRQEASLERILVELYFLFSRNKLGYSLEELGRIFYNISGRVNLRFSLVVNLARRKKIEKEWRSILWRAGQLDSSLKVPQKYAVNENLSDFQERNVQKFIVDSTE